MKDPEPPHIRFAGFKSCLTDTTILAMIELQLTIQLADFCFLDVVATSFFFFKFIYYHISNKNYRHSVCNN